MILGLKGATKPPEPRKTSLQEAQLELKSIKRKIKALEKSQENLIKRISVLEESDHGSP